MDEKISLVSENRESNRLVSSSSSSIFIPVRGCITRMKNSRDIHYFHGTVVGEKKKKEKFEKIGRETVDGGGRKECGNCNDIARNT